LPRPIGPGLPTEFDAQLFGVTEEKVSLSCIEKDGIVLALDKNGKAVLCQKPRAADAVFHEESQLAPAILVHALPFTYVEGSVEPSRGGPVKKCSVPRR